MTLYLIIAFTVAQALPLKGGEIDHQAISCFKDANVATTADAKTAQDAAAGGAVVFAINGNRKGIVVSQLRAEAQTTIKSVSVPVAPKPAKK